MAVIAIDFDNTLIELDTPLEGAKEFLARMHDRGHKIIIHSCNGPTWIKEVLDKHGMVYDLIWTAEYGAKPLADIYIDDRGYHFKGNWEEACEEIMKDERVNNKDNRKMKFAAYCV